MGLILLVLLALAAIGGLTGTGVTDSRDPRFGLSLWPYDKRAKLPAK